MSLLGLSTILTVPIFVLYTYLSIWHAFRPEEMPGVMTNSAAKARTELRPSAGSFIARYLNHPNYILRSCIKEQVSSENHTDRSVMQALLVLDDC